MAKLEITEEMLDAIEAVKGRRDPKYWDPQCRRYMEKQKTKAVKKLYNLNYFSLKKLKYLKQPQPAHHEKTYLLSKF